MNRKWLYVGANGLRLTINKSRRAAYLNWLAAERRKRVLPARRHEPAEPGYVCHTWSAGKPYGA